MKKYIYTLLAAGSIWLAGCNKHDVVDPKDFDVKTTKTTYNAGDTVNFQLYGNPDFVIFYSGESGKKYENATRTKADGKQILSFQTSAQNGTQVNSLALMISTDFKGVYSPEGIAAAKWTDISNRAILSTGAANVNSGNIDISDFGNADQTYIAFKFTGQASATSAQRMWTIKNFVLNNNLIDGTVYPIFANIGAPNWLAVNVLNPNVVWATPSTTQLSINGGPVNTPDNEDWIITSGVNLRAITPDVGTPVRDLTTRLSSYSYVFKTPGTYNVTFVGSNSNVYGQRQEVRKIQLTIK